MSLAMRYGEIRLSRADMIDLTMYVKSTAPSSLLPRIKFVEDHIIQLEREYPPRQALHSNRLHRGELNSSVAFPHESLIFVLLLFSSGRHHHADASHCHLTP